MIAQNVKVTTTSGFDDVKIEKYLEPVTAHVVVGMNLFKDFFAGLTDIFGGKSKTYQNTLSSINEEVINELRKKAYSLGGNCILSLKIDNDEVSAQGKSMMMVSAIGTVAIANFSMRNDTKSKKILSEKYKSKRINSEYFNLLNTRKQYIFKSQNDSLEMDELFWSFVKKNKVHELADYILKEFIEFFDTYTDYYSEELNTLSLFVSDYFLIIDSNISTKCLYNKLKEKLSGKARIGLIKLIKDIKLIDYSEIISLLKNSNFLVQKTGVLLSSADKNIYEKLDIQRIKVLKNIITSSFPQRGEKTTKKKSLSSKSKEIWICECGKENNIDNEYCADCYRDIFGFLERETKPFIAIEKLANISEILTEILE